MNLKEEEEKKTVSLRKVRVWDWDFFGTHSVPTMDPFCMCLSQAVMPDASNPNQSQTTMPFVKKTLGFPI